jgi:Fungal specific transcription factor domain
MVDHLLNLYWSWQHQYFVIIDKDLFLRDLARGGEFASEFLLNAILAHAAPYSTRPGLRLDEKDPGTAGCYYHNRARQMMLMDENIIMRSSVTTCQALALLGSREAGCARNPRGWISSGMSFRMAIDLGLHLDSRKLVDMGYLTEEQYRVRAITFWGCFIFDRGWSAYMGRPAGIPSECINAKRLAIDLEKEAEPWSPSYNPRDPRVADKTFPHRVGHLCTVFERICTITEILGSVIGRLYSSTSKFETSSDAYRADVIAGLYFRLNCWYKELPSHLRCDPSSSEGILPPVIMMQYVPLPASLTVV